MNYILYMIPFCKLAYTLLFFVYYVLCSFFFCNDRIIGVRRWICTW